MENINKQKELIKLKERLKTEAFETENGLFIPNELKIDIVNFIYSNYQNVVDGAKDIGIHYNSIYNWKSRIKYGELNKSDFEEREKTMTPYEEMIKEIKETKIAIEACKERTKELESQIREKAKLAKELFEEQKREEAKLIDEAIYQC